VRIATLLPSATEIVCALGLEDRLVGVSHSCSFPASVGRLPQMTSTRVPFREDSGAIDDYVREHLGSHEALYDLHVERLREARPDVILSQALCDVCAVASGDVAEAVAGLPGPPEVIDLTPNTLDDVFDDIRRVGARLGCETAASALLADLAERRQRISDRAAGIDPSERPRVAFLEWLLPPFSGGHWNPELVRLAGGIDLLGASGQPSSTRSWPDIEALQPDLIFIACCGFDIPRAMQDVDALENNVHWTELRRGAGRGICVSDGQAYFSSPGPRLVEGLEIMARAFHPGVFGEPDPLRCRRL